MKYTHTEWLSELKERFGDDLTKWAFVCPACGKVSTVQEFKDAGADPNDAYQTCIGRHIGKGCNWAAFGLFKTLNGRDRQPRTARGDVIVTEDKKEVPVFSMADPAASGNNEEDEN